MTLLSLYAACSLLPIVCLIVLLVSLLFKGRGMVMLCTECQCCITRCPARSRELNAFRIMLWGKTGAKDETLYSELDAACTRCALCRKDCPRGIAVFELLPERGRRSARGSQSAGTTSSD
jgi:heterodisulfide reductase subunit C